MLNEILPFAVGKSDAGTYLATSLGNLYEVDGKIFRLVQAAAAIALAAQTTLVTALTSGVPTWAVNTSTTANDHLAVGVVPVGQTGTGAVATTLASGDFFLIQISGQCKILSAAAILAGGLIGTTTTAGRAGSATVAAGVGAIGVALEAAAGAGESTDVMLKGIL